MVHVFAGLLSLCRVQSEAFTVGYDLIFYYEFKTCHTRPLPRSPIIYIN